MSIIISLIAVVVLFVAGMAGGAGARQVFGVYVPYAAFAIFLVGIAARVIGWAKIPVPFRIPTSCGQQKSLPWIKHSTFDNPFTPMQAFVRMVLEVTLFRSLLKNTKSQLVNGKPVYATDIWLWLGAMAFHWSFLIIVLRHIRLFVQDTPFFVTAIERTDGFLQVGVPVFYMTSFLLLLGIGYLLARRLLIPQVRYISLLNDYFPLFLLLAIGGSGFFLRYIFKTDIVAIKELAVGLATFTPVTPDPGINALFFGHLFLVCVLLACFPFSKLVHMAGVFLSPTRNLANNNRAVRHINPWNYPVKTHPYHEYEEEFGDLMRSVGIPTEHNPAEHAEKE